MVEFTCGLGSGQAGSLAVIPPNPVGAAAQQAPCLVQSSYHSANNSVAGSNDGQFSKPAHTSQQPVSGLSVAAGNECAYPLAAANRTTHLHQPARSNQATCVCLSGQMCLASKLTACTLCQCLGACQEPCQHSVCQDTQDSRTKQVSWCAKAHTHTCTHAAACRHAAATPSAISVSISRNLPSSQRNFRAVTATPPAPNPSCHHPARTLPTNDHTTPPQQPLRLHQPEPGATRTHARVHLLTVCAPPPLPSKHISPPLPEPRPCTPPGMQHPSKHGAYVQTNNP